MTIAEQYDIEFPSYALSALINGDYSGLEIEDEHALNKWIEAQACRAVELGCSRTHVNYCVQDSGDNFCTHPAFGLPTTCTRVTVLFLK